MPLSKGRDKERKRLQRSYVQPNYCHSCRLATLYPDGRLRCDFTKSENNSLGICVQPNERACINRQEGKPTLYKASRNGGNVAPYVQPMSNLADQFFPIPI